MTTLEFRDRLARRARRARAPLTLAMLEPLEAYFQLLTQWNAKMNLTAFSLDAPTDEAFDRLLVEPIAASKQIPSYPSSHLVDLGSGGGSPAIPLKIAHPSLRLTMIESKERKSMFLREAIRMLGLVDTSVENARFEVVSARPEYSATSDFVTARAVKADSALFETSGQLLKEGGQLLLFRPAHSPSVDPHGFNLVSTNRLVDTPPTFICSYRRVFHVEQSR